MSRLPLLVQILLIISYVSSSGCAAEDVRRDGLIDRLQSGMKLAQGLLGSESVAMKVAEFVVRAFQTANNNRNNNHDPTTTPRSTIDRPLYQQQYHDQHATWNSRPPSPEDHEMKPPMTALRQLVRLLGLEPGQLGAVAVNALLFVSQMIATFLAGPLRRTRPTYGSTRVEDISTSWLMSKESQPLQDLLAAARNDSLAEAVQELIKEQGSPEETSCLRLLACKIAPFVVKMQHVVFGPLDHANLTGDHGNEADYHGNEAGDHGNEADYHGKGIAALYRHLPSKSEILQTSDACEIAHKECDLNED